MQQAQGYVYDQDTKKPINEVCIYQVDHTYEDFSDSSGHFEVNRISGGFFGCPILKMMFKKKGYDSLYVEGDNTHNQIVYLKKSKLPTAHW